jgi:hypothetical protein
VYIDIDAKCSLGSNNLARIDVMVYWLTEDTVKIMAFDLENERVVRNEPLPVPTICPTPSHLPPSEGAREDGRWRVAIYDDDSVTVWVPDGENWSFWYVMEAHKPRQYEKWMMR